MIRPTRADADGSAQVPPPGAIAEPAARWDATPLHRTIAQAIDQAAAARKRVAVLRIAAGPVGPESTMGPDGRRALDEQAGRLVVRPGEWGPVPFDDGGFVMVLCGIDGIAAAMARAESIITALGEPLRIDGRAIPIVVWIGIGMFPEDGGDGESLLRRAAMAQEDARMSDHSSAAICFRRDFR